MAAGDSALARLRRRAVELLFYYESEGVEILLAWIALGWSGLWVFVRFTDVQLMRSAFYEWMEHISPWWPYALAFGGTGAVQLTALLLDSLPLRRAALLLHVMLWSFVSVALWQLGIATHGLVTYPVLAFSAAVAHIRCGLAQRAENNRRNKNTNSGGGGGATNGT